MFVLFNQNNAKQNLKVMNYNNLLTVEPYKSYGTRVTKVTPKPYGFRVQMFNNYITLYYIKLVINDNKSAKAHYLVKKNYFADERYTVYFNTQGEEITQKEYKLLNK